MKIISKYKDFYDHYAGIYGIDEKLVLDRASVPYNKPYFTANYDICSIFFCGIRYDILRYQGKFYYGEELDQFKEDEKSSYWAHSIHPEFTWITLKDTTSRHGSTHIPVSKAPTESDLNDRLNCPIIVIKSWDGRLNDRDYNRPELYPRLEDYHFFKVLSDKECWIQLSNWLSRTKEIPDTQTNEGKIVSHGFDLKKSFRHRK